MQQLMDAQGPPHQQSMAGTGEGLLSRGPNPYLGGDRCLLCRCEKPEKLSDWGEKLTSCSSFMLYAESEGHLEEWLFENT